MDAKGKRKLHKKGHHKKRGLDKSQSRLPRISRLDGITKLYFSPLTQQILDCRIGSKITPQNPWIFVSKEKILENIELHELSSELLPIKEEIERYPEDKILVGSYGHLQDEPEEFMVVTSLDTVHATLNAIKAYEEQRHQKIVDSIVKLCRPWSTLGSETEVNENMTLTMRSHLLVYLTLESPSFFVKCRFSFRLVADSPDGYVELLSIRQTFKNVLRKRVDSFVQCSPLRKNVQTQTMIEAVDNKATSIYPFTKPKKLAKNALEDFFNRLNDAYLFDLLQTNYYMDLCRKEYNFRNALHMTIFKFPLCVLSFQDIFNCRGKKVSSVSWNALKSGLIAASYVKTPHTLIVNQCETTTARETAFEDHLVLVWCYTDTIKPQLYLHCFRDVTTVSFCSFNADIIVGGCDNGQIAVWDISGIMERSRRLKIMNRKEQEHHLVVDGYMKWMKPRPEVHHVYPTLITKIDVSHSSPITYIEWIPPDQYITRNGKFERVDDDDDDKHMQFLTCSIESGSIIIWDIGVGKNAEIVTKKKKIIRLNKIPDALTKFKSPLRALQSNLIPVFKILVANPDTRKPLIISKLLEKRGHINYKALNPETEADIFKRTCYEHDIDKGRDITEQKFICATALGEMRTIKWDGYDYNQGCVVNSNAAKVDRRKIYHDGPICVCMESPIFHDLFLTVGGRVFAIWNIKNLSEPMFWRKTMHRYVTGSWLTMHPFQIGLARYDTYKEIWDLMDDSKKPLKVIRWKGRATIGLFNDCGRMHAKKGTFVEINVTGDVNVFSLPRPLIKIKEEELNVVDNYLQNVASTKQLFLDWTNRIKNKIKMIQGKIEETPDEDQTEEPQQETSTNTTDVKTSRKSLHLETNKWQAKEEAYMREILLANKHLKIDQIMQNTDFIRHAAELKKKHAIKFAKEIKNKEKNMQAWRMLLIPEQQLTVKKKITVNFSKDMIQFMKQSYILNYKDIEPNVIQYIRCHNYYFFYNWADRNKRVKETYNTKLLRLEEFELRRTSRITG